MPRPPAPLRKRARSASAAGRRNPANKLIANLLGGGLFLLLFPVVMGSLRTPIPVPGLQPLGWLLLALGGALVLYRVLMARRAALPAAAQETTQVVMPPRTPRTSAQSPLPPVPTNKVATPAATPSPPPASTAGEAPGPRPTAWTLDVFRVIEWRRFEALVEALFAQAGFITRSQSHGADGGVDVWLHSKNQPDGAPVSIVQCKHWSDNKPVGVDKIRELRGVMAAHNIRRGQFACTARYSDAAREFARDNQINLLDGAALLTLIGQRTAEQQQALLDVALDGEYWKPTCVNCGVKMVFRVGRNEGKGFWGCVNYPKCRSKLYVRID